MKKVLVIFSIILFGTSASGKSGYGVVSGIVADTAGNPLTGANVIVRENNIGCATDERGYYALKLKPGEYHLVVSFIGYEKRTKRVLVVSEKNRRLNFTLASAVYSIGGITVLGERELIPEGPVTRSRINSGEIEHMQASSLSDVLKLIPGQRFDNPGLDEVKQITLRTSETDDDAWRNASLGTQIILDGAPVSNNANMQLETGVNTAVIRRTTENSGIDLRQIPAENIEEVEVIRGIPSVKYGDLTSGVISVRTRDAVAPPRLKFKFNLNNQEANFSGGKSFLIGNFLYNLNLATNQRDVRVPGDGFSRFALQLTHNKKIYHGLWNIRNRFYYTRAYDEQGLREGDLLLSERYNRDYILRLNHESRIMITPEKYIRMIASLQLNRQNSFLKKLVSVDHTYVSDRMEEGTQEGFYRQSYLTKLRVKGRAWNEYLNFRYGSKRIMGGFQHTFLGGITFKEERNDGAGRIFDPLFPPSINSMERDRPRSYADVEPLIQLSLFLEDELSGRIIFPFTLIAGIRAEMYQPEYKPSGFSCRNGFYLNPRINLSLHPLDNTQIRLGYGETSKSPTLAMLFPNPVYYDVDDINRYTGSDNYVLVSTYIFSRENIHLQGSKQIKREVSLDRIFGDFGLSITVYSSNVMDGFASTGLVPVSLNKYNYPNPPDTSGRTVYDTIYTSYSVFENSQFSGSRGVEFSLQTKPLTPLRIKFRLEAAYTYTRSSKNEYDYASAFRYDPNLGSFVKPFWNSTSGWSDNLLINYRLEYNLKEAGIWFTLESQQVVFDRNGITGLSDSLMVGYFTETGDKILVPESERDNPVYTQLHRTYDDWWRNTENKKNVWLFNLRVSKSMGKKGEFSFFVNNLFNSHPLYRRKRVPEDSISISRLNPDLYFGVECSMILGK